MTSQQPVASSSRPLEEIQAPISLGELIDKITILQIKEQHLQGNSLNNVRKELKALQSILKTLDLQVDQNLIDRPKGINLLLWLIEDDIREKERKKDFKESFIALARSVYKKNDQRAAIKKEINTRYNSSLTEEKAYNPTD